MTAISSRDPLGSTIPTGDEGGPRTTAPARHDAPRESGEARGLTEDGLEASRGDRRVAGRPETVPVPPPPDSAGDLAARRAAERAAYERFVAEMPMLDQNGYNSCGTTSLAMVLEYFGIPANFRIIDDYIRPYPGSGTASVPGDLVDYARQMGLQAEQREVGSLEDLAGHIRGGRPCTVLLNYEDPANPSAMAHYLDVLGVERNDAGEITHVHLRNPWGRDETIAAADFMRMWSNVRIIGRVPGGDGALATIGNALGHAVPTYDRTYIVYDRGDAPRLAGSSLVEDLRVSPTNTLMGGVNQLAAGWGAIERGHGLEGAGQITAGVINTLGGGAAMLVGNLIGRNIEQGGEALMGVGRDLLEGPWYEKIGGGLVWFFGAILKAVGWLLSMVGGLIGSATDLLSRPFSLGAERRAESEALTRQLLDDSREHGELDRDEVLRRASPESKAAMLRVLLPLIEDASEDEQRAALRVLRAAEACGELPQIIEAFRLRGGEQGGEEYIASCFDGERQAEVRRLLGLPASAPTHVPLVPESA